MSLTPPERQGQDPESPAREQRDGRIVTFYSYKGGTGRTMALANSAWILAANGHRVLAVDWDLEAPGLYRFFTPFLEQAALDASTGVIDLIHDYREETLEHEEYDAERLRDAARVLPHVLSLNWAGFPGEGCLDFLPAGQAHSDYGATVANINWDDFYARRHGAEFFKALRADMRRQYDYILIDSRTGLSDIQEICTVELPDDLVICFTLSNQSIEGASEIARKITERHYNRGIRILPVPMRIDDGEKGKADAGRALARKRFSGLPQGLSESARDHHWDSVEIPYQPYYAYEEILAPFGDKPGSPTSMLSAVERLVSSVTEERVTSLPPMDEDVRLHYTDLFTRPRPTAREDIILSYASEDRMWAEWIEWVLTRAGLRVVSRELGSLQRLDSDRVRDAVTRTVAVWSQAYAKATQSRLARELLVGERTEDQPDLITVRVGDARSGPSFGSNNVVELLRLEEDAARVVLLRAVGLPDTALMDPVPGEGPRFPGRRPAIWNLRLRNPSFTGRAAVLDLLRDQLRGQQRDRRSTVVLPTPQTLYGLGGVGKTQVALEYAHRFMADYDLVWWIEAEQPEQVAVSLTDLGRRLDLRVGENANENAELVKETLRLGMHPKAKRWLLIFDNADDPSQIVQFFPGGPGDVLVTSRNQAWVSHAEALEVDVFRREESIEHLCRRAPALSPQDAALVAEAVGDLPLAVEIASAWLETTGVPVSDYVDQLHNEAVKALAVTKPVDYPTTFGATWNVSIARLREQMPAAVRLLQLCAFLSADSIAISIFYSDQMMTSLLPYDDELRDKNMMGRVIRAIGRYGLARVDNSNRTFQVHRMVQAVIRAELTLEQEDELVHDVHRILVGARPDFGDTDDPENWPLFELIWPHLTPSNAENCDEADTRQLLIDRVRYLWKRGDLDRAETLGRRLDSNWTDKLGQDDRQTLQLRFQLASVLRSKGLAQECLELDQDTLSRQSRVLRSDHPLTLQTAGNLAADLRVLGRFPEALRRDQETYAKMKEELGEEDPRTLNIANNLAVDYRFNGDYEAARILDEEVYSLRTAVLGVTHPYTLSSKAALAEDERSLGNYARSISLLSEFREEYSVPVPDLASLRYAKSLALSLRRAGQQSEARRLTMDTYNRYLERYSADVPDALSCALNLAAEYSAAGDKELARDTAQEVYRSYRERLGAEHPFTLICANNLTIYLRDIGQPAQKTEAVDLGERTLDRLTTKLGLEHPYTLCAMLNLANSHGDNGDLVRAEELGRAALEGLVLRYGPKHPDALVCQSNLAITMRDRSREPEAQDLRTRAIDQLVLQFGESHPTVYNARAWRRMGRDLELVPA
ncbi:FxSxx-COOH system tetratricopeptide repeat protein [Streptacidiphilus rugosus]|uniref:FxSxx-COOH system tetratricopeptide repeat protein n=1 Tax=Streptacidiphilus rugosus TaxID=405783 RepID=UPI00068DB394|nr:FxSxx-COOH system tetratricopeptide repeat protein [Streptacidiphilus rugosus]